MNMESTLKVDKSNGSVFYNDEQHVYWEGSKKYTSVTTLIGKYEPEYDTDFWAGYKALERLIPQEFFKIEKKQLLDTHKINMKYYLEAYEFNQDEFDATKALVLKEWEDKKNASCARGTKIHAQLEEAMYKNCGQELKKYGLGGKFSTYTNEVMDKTNIDLNSVERGVFPEFLIYRKSPDGILRIAGQIDLLIKDGNEIHIYDYKTNEKIDEKSFFDSKSKKYETMKFPLNNLMNCNKIHYTLQLSTYAWMIQQLNPEFVIKKLMLIHYDHQGNVTEHVVDYLKNDVERMLRDWKKRSVLEERAASRKPIIF